MVVYAYVCRYDNGSAPYVYQGCMTLATCKPAVRKAAQPGDCIIGFQQKDGPLPIFMCRVDQKLDWPQYVRLCEQKLTGRLRSAEHPRGDCYLNAKGRRRANSDGAYHKKAEHMRKDWTSPVVMSRAFVYWGDGSRNAVLPPCTWLPQLLQEWQRCSGGWRGHRVLDHATFPQTARLVQAWARRWGPSAAPGLWTGRELGKPNNPLPSAG